MGSNPHFCLFFQRGSGLKTYTEWYITPFLGVHRLETRIVPFSAPQETHEYPLKKVYWEAPYMLGSLQKRTFSKKSLGMCVTGKTRVYTLHVYRAF